MKHTNFFRAFVLFFIGTFVTNVTGQSQSIIVSDSNINEVEDKVSSSKLFCIYLKNIAKVLHASQSIATTHSLKHVLRVEELIARIEEGFDRGAFSTFPLIKTKFYCLFKDIDITVWPTPSMVRNWKSQVDEYKIFLLAAYFSMRSPTTHAVDYETINALIVLHDELVKNVFTDEFFDFYTSELLADILITQPIEFTQKNPFLVFGTIIAVTAIGYFGYEYLQHTVKTKEAEKAETEKLRRLLQAREARSAACLRARVEAEVARKKAVEAWEQGQGTQVVVAQQEKGDCAAWSLYRQTCYGRVARADLPGYRALACNRQRYNQFKAYAQGLLEQAVQNGRIQQPNVHVDQYLENDHVQVLIEYLQQAGREDNEFGLAVQPYHVASFEMLAPDRIEDIYYRDRELQGPDGNYLVYQEDALPDGRVAHCNAVRGGLRYEALDLNGGPGMRLRIQEFQRARGNTFDFIINTNLIPRVARPVGAAEPPANGHFFHIRAINNPEAVGGVEFIISETLDLNERELPFYSQILANIRNLLRPYEN
jgi:hypothetical protein